MAIPLVDLKAQYLAVKDEIDEAINRVVISGRFILGEEVKAFEDEFADFCDARFAIGTSSGTSALHLALLACDVGPGDEVITTSHTFIATVEAISYTGAKPVFVDIAPESYDIDPIKIREAITGRTRAIVPVHLYGQPAEMDPILAIAKEYGLKVIEDAAQAHGAEYKGKRVGAIGDVGCFSFYPAKNLGAYGDGGMVVTNNSRIAERVRLLRNHGRREKYEHLVEGYGYRLDALQAAILRVKLKRLESWNELRRQHAETYRKLLNDFDLVLPVENNRSTPVYHLFVVRSGRREELTEYLRSKGIETGIHYPIPLHLQRAYRHLGYSKGDFLIAECCANEVLSLPMFPELSRGQIERVVEAIAGFFEG